MAYFSARGSGTQALGLISEHEEKKKAGHPIPGFSQERRDNINNKWMSLVAVQVDVLVGVEVDVGVQVEVGVLVVILVEKIDVGVLVEDQVVVQVDG